MNAEAGVPYNVSIAAVNEAGIGKHVFMIIFSQELGRLYY